VGDTNRPVDILGSGSRTGAISAAYAYAPRVLLEELAAHPDRPLPWLAEIDGTMVMGDISGFTAMSERLAKAGREGAEQLTDIISSFFTTMLDIAAGYGGDTLTFGGDAILLFFSGPDHARRAVAASLDMLAATESLDPFRVGRARIRLGMSMGAHSGSYAFVAAGSTHRAQLLALGPNTVRTASAEAAASSSQLAVTEELLDALGDGAVAEPLGSGLWHVSRVESAGLALQPAAAAVDRRTELLSGPYLPPFAAASVAGGAPLPDLPGEHRKVTVVFANVTGVDSLLARPDPSQLLAEVQKYMSNALASIEERNGYLVSNDIYTDGFKLVVTFGAPVAHEHDVENAIRFVLDLRERIAAEGLTLQHRFGINRGPVYAGDVGSPHRRQYTVMGDDVNLSARLMSHAAMGGALTTQDLASKAGDAFRREDLEPIRVKGKEHPISVCELISEADARQPHGREAAPLVGREDELDRMRAALDAAGTGSGRAVFLRGEAGIGKSRLAEELIGEARAKGWRLLRSSAYEHTKATPYAPWLPVLRRLLALETCASSSQRTRRVTSGVARLAPSQGELAPLLGPLVDAEMPETALVRGLDAAARRRSLFDLVSALVAGAAAERPTVLWVEDLHWADASSISLLSAVAAGCLGRAPLLIVLTERPSAAEGLDLPARFTTPISLAPLSADAAQSLLGRTESLAGAPDLVARALVGRANGNPLFLEELARSVRGSGVLAGLASASAIAVERALDELEFPDRVETLLMSRVDLLEPEVKDMLRKAAVIGQVFDATSLLALEPGPEPGTIESRLRALAAEDLVEPQSAGSLGYRFVHPLIQETAYGSLRFDTRRELHHRFAEHLEALWSDRTGPHLDAIVRHYSRSGDHPKTLVFAVAAAERADAVFAHREAIDYYRIAAENERARNPCGTWARSRLLERVGDSMQVMGCHTDAIPVYRDALKRWARIEARSDIARWSPQIPATQWPTETRHAALCHKIARCYERANRRYDLADKWIDEAFAALPRGYPSLASHMLVTQGFSRLRQGRYEEAIASGRHAAQSARRSGDTAELAWAFNLLGVCYGEVGELSKAVRAGRQAIELLEQLDDLLRLSSAYGNLAACLERSGRLEEALDYNQRSLEIDERTGSADQAAIAHANIGEILVVHGRYGDAESHLLSALDTSMSAGSDAFAGFVLANLARARLGKGHLGSALVDIDRAIELLARAGARSAFTEAQILKAEIVLEQGCASESLSLCRRALHDSDAMGSKQLRVQALRTQARAHAASGNLDAARSSASDSVTLARRMGARYELALSLSAQAEVCMKDESDSCSDAEKALNEALPILRGLGAKRAFENAKRVRAQVRARATG